MSRATPSNEEIEQRRRAAQMRLAELQAIVTAETAAHAAFAAEAIAIVVKALERTQADARASTALMQLALRVEESLGGTAALDKVRHILGEEVFQTRDMKRVKGGYQKDG